MNYACTADWHIPVEAGGGAWRGLAGVGGDALHALSQVVSYCVEHDAALLAAGDQWDGPDPDPEAVAALYRVLEPLQAQRLPLLYILGNHDRGRDWLAPLGWGVRLDDRVVQAGRVRISGVSCRSPREWPPDFGAGARADVGLYHQTWKEWTGHEASVTDLPDHVLAVCGDVHLHRALTPERGPATAVSPGPLTPQSTVEFAPPAFWSADEDLVVRSVPLRGRTFLRLDVASVTDADRAMALVATLSPDPALPEAVARPFVHVRLTADVDGFAEAFRDAAAARGVLARTVSAAAEPMRDAFSHSLPFSRSDAGAGLAAALDAWPCRPASRRLASALTLSGGDRAGILARFRASYVAPSNEDEGSDEGGDAPLLVDSPDSFAE